MNMVKGLIAAIHEANLDYLISAKKLVAEDKAEAIKRLGITEETAEILDCLSLLQVIHLAETNTLLSQVAFNDHVIGQVLTGKKLRLQAHHSVDTVGNKNYFPWLSLSTNGE
jgi:flagellar transcriptional activator FlhD